MNKNESNTIVLVNPRAGRGRASACLKDFRNLASAEGLQMDTWMTEYPGHARNLAAKALEEGIERLIVIGGDGTLSEVADVIAGSEISLGIVPSGTGNDIARSIGITAGRVDQAFRKIINGDTIRSDVAEELISGRRFISFAGCGFPASVAEKANSMKLLKGRMVFFVSLYAVVKEMKAFPVSLEIDGVREETVCTSVMVHNTPFTGGGLKIAPGAEIDDGYLEVVLVGEIGTLELMANFPRLYSGNHLRHPAFRMVRGRKISIVMPGRQLVSYDGETDFARELDIQVNQGAIKLIV